jgi:hypothetical protein
MHCAMIRAGVQGTPQGAMAQDRSRNMRRRPTDVDAIACHLRERGAWYIMVTGLASHTTQLYTC